ncbi:immunity protein BlpZ [Streptococcus pneumoniae]|uniref:immunity protein BlpZ n=2 Tax=Streptococcus pneumoniae TaxID=1313 RepID=UPI0005E2F7F4|nr:immunity protein BlpZ [Streptococcus pneumoniae]CMZ05685.1 immunity protein BlpZ [Streptococcus pneumoniae]
MYKHLFFLDSKTLDRLTPYILVLASDTIAFNVFVLTFVSAVVFNFLNSMLALMAIFIGAGYVVGFWLLQRANWEASRRLYLSTVRRR